MRSPHRRRRVGGKRFRPKGPPSSFSSSPRAARSSYYVIIATTPYTNYNYYRRRYFPCHVSVDRLIVSFIEKFFFENFFFIVFQPNRDSAPDVTTIPRHVISRIRALVAINSKFFRKLPTFDPVRVRPWLLRLITTPPYEPLEYYILNLVLEYGYSRTFIRLTKIRLTSYPTKRCNDTCSFYKKSSR